MLIVHEVMGRHCGWLTAAAARSYRAWLDTQEWVPSIGLSRERWDIHAVFLPEMHIDIEGEAQRLRAQKRKEVREKEKEREEKRDQSRKRVAAS